MGHSRGRWMLLLIRLWDFKGWLDLFRYSGRSICSWFDVSTLRARFLSLSLFFARPLVSLFFGINIHREPVGRRYFYITLGCSCARDLRAAVWVTNGG